jgi:hypothetical protein
MLRTTLLAAIALALGACTTPAGTPVASADAAPTGDCFRNADISGFSVIDENHVRVRAGQRTYILTTDWPATEISWGHVLAIRSPSSWICTGDGRDVRIIGSQPVRSFYVTGIERGPDHAIGAPGSTN